VIRSATFAPPYFRELLLSFLLLLSVSGLFSLPAEMQRRTPILLELFTSEGCSSCPPIDIWVEHLDAAQPVSDAQLIVLSEHIDYFDHEGWKDPFSSVALTERQKIYASRFQLSDVYTPQVILDGEFVVNPTQTKQVRQIFEKVSKSAMLPLRIDSAKIERAGPGILTGRVAIDASSNEHNGDVYIAAAIERTTTDVIAGENQGKRLTSIAVVKSLFRLGKLENGEKFTEAFRVKLWEGMNPDNLRVVAFVQEPDGGKVLGATMVRGIRQE
jgi:hypothetical protein